MTELEREKELKENIDKLYNEVEKHDDFTREYVNSHLIEVEKFQSLLNTIDPVSQEEYGTKIIKIRERLISFARWINNCSKAVITIDSSDVIMEDILSDKGGCGVIYKGKIAGSPVAVKEIKIMNSVQKEKILAEVSLMSIISNTNIVRYLGASVKNDSILIVSELCEGDLEDASCEATEKITQTYVAKAMKWLCQAARGLAWMHDMCYMVHRDVKPANILLRNGEALITDFGFTKPVLRADDKLTGCSGSMLFMAPEIWEHKPFSFPADVYSFGLTMYSVLSGRDPFSDISDPSRLVSGVLSGSRPNLDCLKEECPSSVLKLIRRCWAQDPADRPKMSEVFDSLKSIFIETIDRKRSLAFKFWLDNFGDEVTDSVPLHKLLRAMPGFDDEIVIDRRLYLLNIKDYSLDTPVTLTHVRNVVCWYGDWFNIGTLEKTIMFLRANRWMVRDIGEAEADTCLLGYYKRTGRKCFLVRCNSVDPIRNPYIISVFTGGLTVLHYPIKRVSGEFCCQALSGIILHRTINHLISALVKNKLLSGDLYSGDHDDIPP